MGGMGVSWGEGGGGGNGFLPSPMEFSLVREGNFNKVLKIPFHGLHI